MKPALVITLLLLLAACAADPLARACAPLTDAVAYANCRLTGLTKP